MKIEGTYAFDAPQDVVWQMLLDHTVLANVMPGCEKLEKTGEDEYEGKMKIKMGPVQSTFQGKVMLSELEPPETPQPTGYKMRVSGRGPAGIVDGAGNVRLEADGDKTIMYYAGDANVSGRIASVGQRVMDTSARAIVKQSLESLANQIQARLEPAPAPVATETGETADTVHEMPSAAERPAPSVSPEPEQAPGKAPQQATAPGAPSEFEFAASIARELFYEFVPEDKRTLVLAGSGLLLIVLFFNWWTNVIARRVARQLEDEYL